MVRKFLYAIVVLVVLVIGSAFALRVWGDRLEKIAFVPTTAFEEQDALAGNAYADTSMWLSHPRFTASTDPSRWRPEQATIIEHPPSFAVFFVHPTSYLERAHWNASLDDRQSKSRARTFLRGLASAFNTGGVIWAPRYRQATFGAFLTDDPAATRAIDLAYRDVAQAFDDFLANVDTGTPIVLAGHSQGARHILQLLHDRIAGTPLQDRIAMVYAIGWPISVEHDLPALGLPACETAGQGGCIMSWSSFAEPADPSEWLKQYRTSPGFDGQPRGESGILCVNPITGERDGAASAAANSGTLVPDANLKTGELVSGSVPARCDERGLLLIGDPPELGPYVLPGNNYHVYDIPLFWEDVREDVVGRVRAWQQR